MRCSASRRNSAVRTASEALGHFSENFHDLSSRAPDISVLRQRAGSLGRGLLRSDAIEQVPLLPADPRLVAGTTLGAEAGVSDIPSSPEFPDDPGVWVAESGWVLPPRGYLQFLKELDEDRVVARCGVRCSGKAATGTHLLTAPASERGMCLACLHHPFTSSPEFEWATECQR